MNFIRLILSLCGMVCFSLLPAADLWANRVYTWTDKCGIVHITETPPPSGVAVASVMNNPPSSPPSSPPKRQERSPSIWDWKLRQAEMEVHRAQQRLQEAAKNAKQAEMQAQGTLRRSEEYIETHDKNQYMRRAFKFQLKQARQAVEDAEAKAQEAVDQLTKAEQEDQAAQEQLREAQEEAKVFNNLNRQ